MNAKRTRYVEPLDENFRRVARAIAAFGVSAAQAAREFERWMREVDKVRHDGRKDD